MRCSECGVETTTLTNGLCSSCWHGKQQDDPEKHEDEW